MADTNTTVAEKRMKPRVRRAKSIIALCFCALLAFSCWVYVMLVESPEYEQVFSGVTVNLTETDSLDESGLAVISGYGSQVDVTLSGKKSTVSKLSPSDIVVTASTSGVKESGRYNLKIVADVPNGCKLVGISQDTVTVYVDTAAIASVDLKAEKINAALPEGCFLGDVDLTVDKITVTGPYTVLNKVDHAIVTLDMTGVTKSTSLTAKVTLADASGAAVESPYLDYAPKEVTVDIPVMKTVKVPLEVEFKQGFLSYDSVSVTVEPDSVEVTGLAEVMSADELIVPIVIDEKTAFENGDYRRIVVLEGIDGVELSVKKAEITVKLNNNYGTRTLRVPEENITVSGGDGTKYSVQTDDYEVTLLGEKSVLELIDGENLKVRIDLSPYADDASGTIRVKAEVTVDSQYAAEVLTVGNYYGTVTFGK